MCTESENMHPLKHFWGRENFQQKKIPTGQLYSGEDQLDHLIFLIIRDSILQ